MRKQDRPKGKRGAAYLRCSDDQQSVASQRPIIRDWLAARGLTAGYWFEDEGWARDKASVRPDFGRLNALVDAGKLDFVVIAEQDRASWEDPWAFAAWVHRLRSNDVELWSVSQGCLSSLDVSVIITVVFGAVKSREEVAGYGDRVVRGKADKARQGRWMGGACPPFGFDVACCDPAGVEVWRIHYEGKDRRVKVHPDGRRERFDGQRNRAQAPTKQHYFTLTPSIDEGRVEWCRKIWGWVDTETITLGQVARRLNDLGVRNTNGSGFCSVVLATLLRNPAYKGEPSWNKRGHGKYRELAANEQGVQERRDVQTTRGKAKKGRKRDRADWVTGECEGIIEPELFARVLAKVNSTTRKTSAAPRCDAGYYAGLVFCDHCGRRMTYNHDKNCSTRRRDAYSCSTYRRFARTAANATGCRMHKVMHEEVEAVVGQYLEEVGAKIDLVLASGHEAALLRELEGEKWDKARRLLQCYDNMRKFVEASLGESSTLELATERGVESYDVVDVTREYGDHYRRQEKQARARIGELTETIQGLVMTLGRLRGTAQEMALAEIDRAETEKARLQASLVRQDDRAATVRQELLACRERAREAKESLCGSENRRKAAALQKVIARVMCRFEHFSECGQDRSRLVSVRIEPLVGESREYQPEASSSRGFGLIVLLSRTYSGDDLRAA